MFCHKCGVQNQDTNKFCEACGAPLVVHKPAEELAVGGAAEIPAQPMPAVELPSTGHDIGKRCPVCSKTYSATLRFCEDDGASLVAVPVAPSSPPIVQAPPVPASKKESEPSRGNETAVPEFVPEPAAAAAAAEPPVSPETEGQSASQPLEPDRSERRLVPALLAAFVMILIAGGAYAYWSGKTDTWLGKKIDPDPVSESSGELAVAKAPGLLGRYKAHLSDQDIVLTIAGESPKPLVSSAGTVTYLNTVNGGTCTASLVPIGGGGVGGDTGNAVSFRQTAVPGKPECPQDIPVKMDITGQPAGNDGIVGSIDVKWHSPNTNKVLMSGKLEKEAGQ